MSDFSKNTDCMETAIWYNGSAMRYISSTPDIMGGAPVITGTRIPIEVILYRLKEGHTLDELHQMYPWVERSTLEGAIDEAIHLVSTTFHAE